MQSNERQAGTRPTVLIRPRDGLKPTTPLSAGGTRPDPAVSVATVKGTSPSATASAEPELEPPEISSCPKTLRGIGYGVRVPFSPVANWSRLFLPISMAPASSSRWTTGAVRSATYAYPGQASVVGQPATSMLSFTPNGMP